MYYNEMTPENVIVHRTIERIFEQLSLLGIDVSLDEILGPMQDSDDGPEMFRIRVSTSDWDNGPQGGIYVHAEGGAL